MRVRLLTTLAAVGALAVCAWFVLGVVQAENQAHAEAALGSTTRVRGARAATVGAQLRRAGILNPDRSVDIDRVQLLLAEHRFAAARRLAETVTQAEPENLEAWVWLAHSAVGHPALYLHALRRARHLEPLLP